MTSNMMVSLPKSKPDYFTPKQESAQAFLTIDADFRQLPERQSLREKRCLSLNCHQRSVLLTGEPSLLSS
ncbi:hypothetical protein E2V02_15935 [Salmonella enterica]|nr:hypothetical protein [Salmonella enterica]EAW2131035.1 hypothetical protein [Salmonella enterica subsp. enterica]EBI0038882.1 hypothetical protein [Salmonella enterica subsp. diarizonae serovar 61:k:z35]EHY70151.1 hypothetical protein SEHO0A_01209 [Salmonella enterica subsp. houtenae str. ATCC BAA-1581]EAM6609745.1 hypothetical protein [Salmonella enterica]